MTRGLIGSAALFLFFGFVILTAQNSKKTPTSQSRQWWQHAVFYESYPRSFADSNNDGVGDLNGITSKLDYLKDLGVDAIWITPFFPSPQVDFGYDVSDYEAIDPMYGTMADFDALVAAAKKHGIRVILDFVVNHTSDKHKWFQDSQSSRTSKHATQGFPASSRTRNLTSCEASVSKRRGSRTDEPLGLSTYQSARSVISHVPGWPPGSRRRLVSGPSGSNGMA